MLFARTLIAALILLAVHPVPARAAEAADSAAAAQTAPDRSSGTRERESAAQMSLARATGQELVIVPAEGGLPLNGLKLPRFSGLPAPVCYICDEPPQPSGQATRQEQEDTP